MLSQKTLQLFSPQNAQKTRKICQNQPLAYRKFPRIRRAKCDEARLRRISLGLDSSCRAGARRSGFGRECWWVLLFSFCSSLRPCLSFSPSLATSNHTDGFVQYISDHSGKNVMSPFEKISGFTHFRASESGGGPPHSRTLRASQFPHKARGVPDCATPLALFSVPLIFLSS